MKLLIMITGMKPVSITKIQLYFSFVNNFHKNSYILLHFSTNRPYNNLIIQWGMEAPTD